MPNILCVVTSHSEIDSEHATGLWLEEYAGAFRIFRDAGCELVTVSPHGGQVPIDPRSREAGGAEDAEAVQALATTQMLHQAGDVLQYDAIYIPGGHGAMFDLAQSVPLKALLSEFDAQGKVVASICHGPAAFVDAIRAGEPRTLVAERRITCFTDAEERDTGLAELMPFLLASKLREQGANVIENPPWSDHVEVDGKWVTGQNPQSTASTARAILAALR
ncbi:MAG TPA: type 1 glutamine amidotransferase domain-containing protein [Candidatus Tumulicola sp.]